MKILGIETSCDETCAAVVEDGRRVLSNVVASQADLHRKYGGVVPEIASRAHLEAMVPVVSESLAQAGLAMEGVDAVAVVHRPGLIGSLLLGLTAAKTLAWLHELPLVGINHVESHIYAGCLERETLPFPCISLIVSGGHTSLYASVGPCRHELLGSTTDDAVGEAFDKVASLLGLEYPGGPSIDRAGEKGSAAAVAFPRPWLGAESLDFSFSGLKTAVLYHVRGRGAGVKARESNLSARQVADIAASFEACAVEVLVGKTLRAAEKRGADRILIGGGVAANRRLRAQMGREAQKVGIEVILPAMGYCTDNAAMVAGLAYHVVLAGKVDGLGLEACA
jgi:N6-L-threonylcarbamoyladenine synthase